MSRSKSSVLIATGMLAVAACGCGRDVAKSKTSAAVQKRSVPLRIVAYNVHLLPDVAAKVAGTRSEPGYRARTIAARLAQYDLIGICEAFDRDHTQTLVDAFQAGTSTEFAVAKSPERASRFLASGGLLLLSRFPIEETHTLTYTHASRFLSSGFKADGFAAKGALHARIRLDDDPHAGIDCFLTHLESRSKRARDSQIKELAGFIARHAREEYPVIVLGDFNVAADVPGENEKLDHKTPYQRLRAALTHNGRQLVDVGGTLQPASGGTSDPLAEDGGDRIDYIFVSDAKSTASGRIGACQ